MRKIKNILLCGLGAIGTIYADKLCKKSDINFKILVDSKRLKRYTETPVLFNQKNLPLEFITPEETVFKADLIILATKFSGLTESLSEISNFVYKDTIIMPLQNGIISEKIVAEKYGWDKVLYAYYIGHSAVRKENLVTHDGVNKIVFGSEIKNDYRIQLVKSLFDYTEINYEVPEDIKYSQWAKFLLNISSNPTTALFRMTFGQMQSNPKFLNFARNIMKEAILIAKAEGINHTENLIDKCMDFLMTMSPDGKTSMLQDIEANRKTENEIFAKTISALGKQHNIQTPICDVISEMFDIIDYNK